jgi:hypothetical protein
MNRDGILAILKPLITGVGLNTVMILIYSYTQLSELTPMAIWNR